jgi:hypothetical protein
MIYDLILIFYHSFKKGDLDLIFYQVLDDDLDLIFYHFLNDLSNVWNLRRTYGSNRTIFGHMWKYGGHINATPTKMIARQKDSGFGWKIRRF